MSDDWKISVEGTEIRHLIKKRPNDSVGCYLIEPNRVSEFQRLVGSYAFRAGRKTSCKSYQVIKDYKIVYMVLVTVTDKRS